MDEQINIRMLPTEAGRRDQDMKRLVAIINKEYDISEVGLWQKGTERTTVEEVKELTRNGEIAVAEMDGEIIGCVRATCQHTNVGEFGMLAVDSDYQDAGVGGKLIYFAEQQCAAANLEKIQIELLVPMEGSHPSKVILEKWYKRLGYKVVHTVAMDNLFPELAKMLKEPCEFLVFEKEL